MIHKIGDHASFLLNVFSGLLTESSATSHENENNDIVQREFHVGKSFLLVDILVI